ncbi:flagellar biosynthesis anti-sigma factor FlgM [Shewanella schlegeliana]|uniref:Negative regulator of flagellin synthesis n=1 Tax=Shewanella schlegeliana TaxID=190308 RepID=A0ABS1SSN4_9GAMM|nr:flagellar biosynthesis anti-sigma factor FlgM [Shewanella schlegeliana]MBL4911557.1 flagellar biosynthesis anti-sigma factor FlgM [Shewanella schlegeliana]MCL1111758.1 flagellar biosynthesis anti-sigma factor FlgM [Shewanella schlegeliana]GIU36037.1 flagellar biosynthesis anti-sigma factor FlgM [Shewanella schlegeliana]
MAIDIKQINSHANTRVTTGNGAKTASAQTAPATATPVPQKSDSVSITAQAQQIQNVQTKMADMPEIDQKKVDEIKAAIAEGRYKIDPEKLATNIASFENELKDLN